VRYGAIQSSRGTGQRSGGKARKAKADGPMVRERERVAPPMPSDKHIPSWAAAVRGPGTVLSPAAGNQMHGGGKAGGWWNGGGEMVAFK